MSEPQRVPLIQPGAEWMLLETIEGSARDLHEKAAGVWARTQITGTRLGLAVEKLRALQLEVASLQGVHNEQLAAAAEISDKAREAEQAAANLRRQLHEASRKEAPCACVARERLGSITDPEVAQ